MDATDSLNPNTFFIISLSSSYSIPIRAICVSSIKQMTLISELFPYVLLSMGHCGESLDLLISEITQPMPQRETLLAMAIILIIRLCRDKLLATSRSDSQRQLHTARAFI